jgi:heavy metal translocating P-type ATPase
MAAYFPLFRSKETAVPRGRNVLRKYALIVIAATSLFAIVAHLFLRLIVGQSTVFARVIWCDIPLLLALAAGGMPLVVSLLAGMLRGKFSSDLLAGISIATSVVLGEYLAGTFVVLMLSGGELLEEFAVRRASAVLGALAKRMPTIAHLKRLNAISDVPLEEIAIGDLLVVFPHEACPADGTVVEGHGSMDESYLTGEPFLISKTPGAGVLSGAINGESALTIKAERRVADSRYAKIMRVMRESEQGRPELRRLGDMLGAYYTPVAVAIALLAWAVSGDVRRFLAVLVVATPCPLIIAIPVAVIGAVSLAARRGIIIKDPAILEQIENCRIAVFDKTGTLTYGKPKLSQVLATPEFLEEQVLAMAASLERYSRHPLALAVLDKANEARLSLSAVTQVSERPGEGLRGLVGTKRVQITSRKQALAHQPELTHLMFPAGDGMECVVIVDDKLAGLLRFRDEPRADGGPFIRHLKRRHRFERVMIVSGDREAEVRVLAEKIGIQEVHAGQTPEQKLNLVKKLTTEHKTLFLGDGINDAPALTAATVGVAFGQVSEITTEAAGAVVLDSSLERVDELFHIGRGMRRIALQSAVGGMILSALGMLLAAAGVLTPIAGAIFQEIIDVLAITNALRAGIIPHTLTDF